MSAPDYIQTPEFPSPRIAESRRLTGPNLYSARPGAVLEVTSLDDALLDAWRTAATHLIGAMKWELSDLVIRREKQGASLFLAAPVDVLMTATEVNEQAWVAAESGVVHAPDAARVTLETTASAERATRPHFAHVYAEARRRGLTVAFDDALITLGGGAGSRTWSFTALPDVGDIAWAELNDVPIALVTGSNGKTTTTRLVAAMWRAHGSVTGWSCSDGVWVDDTQLEGGDYAGPAGAREVLRDHRVQAAVLETARGGMLRRGLAVTRASAAIITNISPDHFGEYGIDTLGELAEVKGIVARALGDAGHLVLNADDPLLVDLASRIDARVAWFSVKSSSADACVRDGRVLLQHEEATYDLGAVDDMPVTFRGAAPHNIENVLGAALLASVAGVSVDAIRSTLATFGSTPRDNPGRLHVYRIGGVTLLTDYAHNPGGLAALCETARTMPAERRLLLLGQAGNRDDEQLQALVRAAWEVMPFDRVIVKEMPTMLRGRALGDVPRVFCDELTALGARPDQVEVVVGELAAIRRAVTWAREGDILVCPVHVEKAAVLAWLARVSEVGWRAGQPLPD